MLGRTMAGFSLFNGLKPGFEAVFNAIRGIRRSRDGIHFFVQGFFGGQAVPGIEEACVDDTVQEIRGLVVVEHPHLDDFAFVVQGNL